MQDQHDGEEKNFNNTANLTLSIIIILCGMFMWQLEGAWLSVSAILLVLSSSLLLTHFSADMDRH